MPPFLITLLLSITAFILYQLTYRLCFHPLSHIPGPFLARLTKFHLVYHVRKGQNHTFLPSLHARYGPLVRITPDTVLACSEDAMKLGYSTSSTFTKGEWYQMCAAPDKVRRGDEHLDLLTETDMEKYRRQRRAIGPAYSMKGMEAYEGVVQGYVEEWLAAIERLYGKEVDLATWTHIFALDAISLLTLGTSPDYTSLGIDGGNAEKSDAIWACFTVLGLFPGLVRVMHRVPRLGTLLMPLACWVLGLAIPERWPVMKFAVPIIMKRLKGSEAMKGVTLPANRPGLAYRSKEKGGRSGRTAGARDEECNEQDKESNEEANEGVIIGKEKDMLSTLIALQYDKTARFRPTWVLSIALTNFGAGHETLMLTLASCIYHVYTSPHILAQLRQDMETHNITANSSYTDIVSKIPLFTAVLKESMRLWPAVGFLLPRTVPPSGALLHSLPSSPPTYLLPGSTLAISLWAIHRNADFFPDPHSFRPERWVHDGTDASKRAVGCRDAVWMGFGSGARSCPGQYMARFLVVRALVGVVEKCEVEIRGEPEFGGWFGVGVKGLDAGFAERGGGGVR